MKSLRAYQWRIVTFLIEHPRCNIWADMGTGKTVSVLTFLHLWHVIWGEERPTLVLGPLRVVQSVWPAEVTKWPHLAGLVVVAVTGTVEERRAALRTKAHVYCINYDNVPWLVKEVGDAWPFLTVVPDEAPRLKSFRLKQGGVRAAALGKWAHVRVKRWINLTGTPAPNGLVDLWGQNWFVDAGARLGRSYSAFETRWFAWKRRNTKDQYAKDMVLVGNAQEEIEDSLRDVTLRVSNPLGVDKPIVNVISVELPPGARRQYKEFEREMFLELKSGAEIEAFNAASKTIKCLQLANGAAYTEAPNWEEVHDAKIEALKSVVEEAAGTPVLVAYHFKSDLTRLRRAFPQGRALDADPVSVAAWNAGRVPLLFAHPASAGHGLNLQDGGNILVFFGLWWDLEQHDQIIERIGPMRQKQSGYDRAVYVHLLVAKGTVDELIVARLNTKASVQQTLLDAMKEQT